MLAEKHRPKKLGEMVGNGTARLKFETWLRKWKRGSKAALLVGPPGTGKTTTVHLVADAAGLNLVELNASDSRTREKLSRKLGQALTSTSLFGEKTLVFLDEVDGLAGRADYGAIDFIKDAVRKSANPIVMAANNPEADEVRKLASVTTRIEFAPLTDGEVLVYLRKINGEEKVGLTDDQMFAIAESAKGDLRYALNSLQGGAAGGKDQELTAAQAVNAFIDASDQRTALNALRAYPGQPREKVRDLFSTVVSAELSEDERAEALKTISRADVLMGRIMRGQEWRLLRYLDPMLCAGLGETLSGAGARFTAESVPWMLQLRIWNDSRKIKEISGLAGRRLHISAKGCAVEDVPYIVRLSSAKPFRDELLRSLNLDQPYEAFIAKESTRSVQPQRRASGR